MLRAWGRGGAEVWRCGGVEVRCRRVASCLERSGAREACCGPGDVEV